MAKKPMKGVAGKNTGGKTRKAIRAAQKRGCTLTEIARRARRSPDTISAIKSGEIKNPPRNLVKAIKSCKRHK